MTTGQKEIRSERGRLKRLKRGGEQRASAKKEEGSRHKRQKKTLKEKQKAIP